MKILGPQRTLKAYMSITKQDQLPTVREVADAAGLKSTSTVHAHLRYLRLRGHDLPTRGKGIYTINPIVHEFARDLSRAVKRGIVTKQEIAKIHNQLKEKLKNE